MENKGTVGADKIVQLSYSEQLAIILTFQACTENGVTYSVIADRHKERSESEANKQAWEMFVLALDNKTRFTNALVRTKLFAPDIETILGVIEDDKSAMSAVVQYLSVIVHRQHFTW